MSPEAKAAFLAERPWCELRCGRPSVQVDHDHISHEARGALCRRCNSRLGSLEAALRLPERLFQSLAGDLHHEFWKNGSVNLAAYRRDLGYLGLTAKQYAARLRRVNEQLVLPHVYWTGVAARPPGRDTLWTKIGPLCDDDEARRHLERIAATAPPTQLWVQMTREPDDGVNSPAPRCLITATRSTEGAREAYLALHAALPDTSGYEARDRAFAELAVPVLLSRPLTAEQFRAAHWRDDEQLPATDRELRELLLRYGYMAGWMDLAVRIVLEDLAGDLPDARWAVFSRARHHWLVLFAHWRERRGSPSAA
ncbi:endonuclease domain-containing protein (plasmid) [Kitasatospora griseola]|uniref:endonuclease domain-containing protein n=1 Tax=Kitasatospora griseola TaxID=2064 RepID=UPI003855F786